MPSEVLAALRPADGDVIVDSTFGCGGHAREVLRAAAVTLIAVDRDPHAVATAERIAADAAAARGCPPGRRVVPLLGRFGALGAVLECAGWPQGSVDGVLLDVGASSAQLDQPERGFSFARAGPLDMRMGGEAGGGPTAADVVNTATAEDLATVLRAYSDEKRAVPIARAIVAARRRYGGFKTTTQLAAVVEAAVEASSGGKGGKGGNRIHPATRTFQALRILVNGELDELASGLESAAKHVRVGGRVAVLTFHSLELRLVRRFARRSASAAVAAELGGRFRWAGPTAPTDGEVESNPRARSASLMVGEKMPFDGGKFVGQLDAQRAARERAAGESGGGGRR